MISASKTTFRVNNLKILRPKVTKNIKNLSKKFCEFPPRNVQNENNNTSDQNELTVIGRKFIFAQF